MTEHDSCFLCGCVPLAEAIPAVLASIAEEGRLVPPRLSAALGAMDDDQKATVIAWLTGTLERPPLDTHAPAWAPIVDALTALLYDLADRTIDPASPVAAGWLIPLPHPRVIAAMRGETTVSHGDGTSTTLIVDDDGFVQ